MSISSRQTDRDPEIGDRRLVGAGKQEPVREGKSVLRSLAAVGLGLAGLALGGFPYLAARRILYPDAGRADPRKLRGGPCYR